MPQLILQKAHAKLQILALTNNCLAKQSKTLVLLVMIAMQLESYIQGCVFMDNTLEHQMEHVLRANSTLTAQRTLRRQLTRQLTNAQAGMFVSQVLTTNT